MLEGKSTAFTVTAPARARMAVMLVFILKVGTGSFESIWFDMSRENEFN